MPVLVRVRACATMMAAARVSAAHAAAAHEQEDAYCGSDEDPVLSQPFHVFVLSYAEVSTVVLVLPSQICTRRSRSALRTTDSEEALMAEAAKIGLIRRPSSG